MLVLADRTEVPGHICINPNGRRTRGGGANDRDAAGVKAFKAGLGVEAVRPVGQYR